MSTFLLIILRFWCQFNLKILYIIGETILLPVFLAIIYLGINVFTQCEILYNVSFFLLFYYSLGAFFLAFFLRKPSNLLRVESFVGKEFLHRNVSHSGAGGKEGSVAAGVVDVVSTGVYQGGQYVREEQHHRQQIEIVDRIKDVGDRARLDGDNKMLQESMKAELVCLKRQQNVSSRTDWNGITGCFAASEERKYVNTAQDDTSDDRSDDNN